MLVTVLQFDRIPAPAFSGPALGRGRGQGRRAAREWLAARRGRVLAARSARARARGAYRRLSQETPRPPLGRLGLRVAPSLPPLPHPIGSIRSTRPAASLSVAGQVSEWRPVEVGGAPARGLACTPRPRPAETLRKAEGLDC